jgi:hypothetical protein
MLPNALVITGISFLFSSHICCISVARSLYFTVSKAYILVTFLSAEIAASMKILVPFALSLIVMSDLFVICLVHQVGFITRKCSLFAFFMVACCFFACQAL